MKRQMLLNRPVLILRDEEGNVSALDDHCPHRGIPLSDGTFDGREIECCYHGWRFDCRGKCTEIPSLLPDSPVKPERICAKELPCKEADGLIWVYIPASKSDEASEPPRIPTFSENYKLEVISTPFKCSMEDGVLGLIDPAHTSYVHQSWFWRTKHNIREKKKRFEQIPNGWRMSSHTPSSNSAAYKLLKIYNEPITTTIDFILPNRRIEVVRCGKYFFTAHAIVTPVTEKESRLDFVAAWNILNWVPFVRSVYRIFARKFLAQDQSIMEKQSVGLRDDPNLMLIDDADTQAKWYFQLKEAYQKAQRDGSDMEHPIKEPTVLRWRS